MHVQVSYPKSMPVDKIHADNKGRQIYCITVIHTNKFQNQMRAKAQYCMC